MTRFCSKCGKKAGKDEYICDECGENIIDLSNDKSDNKEEKKDFAYDALKILTVIALVIMILISAAAALGRYYNVSKNRELKVFEQTAGVRILKDIDYNEIDIHGEKLKILSKKEEYMSKLKETDKYVQKNIKDNISSIEGDKLVKYTGDAYNRYDTLLNEIYSNIVSNMDEEEASKLRDDERKWIVYKENKSTEGMESDEYSDSENKWVYFDYLAVYTRQRCYELIERYMY